MSRLIDADVLKQGINKVSTHWLNEWSTLGVLAMVDKQPTVDAVPVVRCGECKYRYVDGDNVRFNLCLLNHNKVQSNDWYCADGERKGGDE